MVCIMRMSTKRILSVDRANHNDAGGETMTVEEAVRTRRSVTHLGGGLDREVVSEILKLALWAPNHHLTEPWTISVVLGAGRDRLADAWANEVQSQLSQEPHKTPDMMQKIVDAERAKVYRAPCLIFVSVRPPTGNSVTDEEDYAATAALIQNILLLAHAKGLGAIWRTGKMLRSQAVKKFLGLAEQARIVGIVYLGNPTKPGLERPRNLNVIRWLCG